MRKTAPTIATAILITLMAATAAFAGGGPFPGLDGGKPTVMASTTTADGLAISLKLNANVKDGGSSPFWLRIRRVRGDSSRYLVAAMAFSFDHSPLMRTAAYTVQNGNVVFSRWARKQASVSATPKCTPANSKAVAKATPPLPPVHTVQSRGAHATSETLVNCPENLEFADGKNTLMRIGQLHVGEYVTVSGTVYIEKRSDWHASNALFFRLHAGVSQVSPDDSSWPEPAWSLTASSLYTAPYAH